MATLQSRGRVAVGSAQWVLEEKNAAVQYVKEETEEFAFAVRNEVEWLNEHMAEMFDRDQFNVVESFKTPGKLRGKTPRTVRQNNGHDNRAPLTDIFAPNAQTIASPRSVKSPKAVTPFIIAEDADNEPERVVSTIRFSPGIGKENAADSGYHEMTDATEEEEEEEASKTLEQTGHTPTVGKVSPSKHLDSAPTRPEEIVEVEDENIPAHDEAMEDVYSDPTAGDGQLDGTVDTADVPKASESFLITSPASSPKRVPEAQGAPSSPEVPQEPPAEEEESPIHMPEELQPESSPSDQSTPARPLLRKKSSLTFASLPAREPLTTKKSFGPGLLRTSQMGPPRLRVEPVEGHFAMSGALDSAAHVQHNYDQTNHEQTQPARSPHPRVQAQPPSALSPPAKTAEAELKAQSRASTMRLQERLAMLSKSNAPRLSRSVPSTILITQTTVQQSPGLQQTEPKDADDADDWIGPFKTAKVPGAFISSLPRSPTVEHITASLHAKPADPAPTEEKTSQPLPSIFNYPDVSTSASTSQPFHNLSSTPSYPKLKATSNISYTPQGSPTQKKHFDGPLSASKAKLQSMLKSARGIFSNTAHGNASPTRETAHPDPFTSAPSPLRTIARPAAVPAAVLEPLIEQEARTDSVHRCGTVAHSQENDRLAARRSSGRLAAKKAETEAAPTTERAPAVGSAAPSKRGLNIPQLKITTQKPASTAQDSRPETLDEERTDLQSTVSSPAKPQARPSQLQKPGEIKRLLRPTKEASKARPAPVSIKLASQRIGQIAPANTSLGMALHESMSQPAPARPALTKKASTSSFTTSASSTSFKTSTSAHASRPKALDAAARKREQDEREAQRKAEQKREMERRRAAKAEEDRRAAEEQKALEQQRAAEAKNAAQRQKAEAIKRAEQAKKEALMRSADDLVNSSTVGAPAPRNVVSQENARLPIPHVNPAKPPKRHLDPEEDNSQPTSLRPTIDELCPPQKRRRTSEDSSAEPASRPTMAPPIRPSNMHKNKFTQGFLNNVPPHAAPSMLKTAVTTQHILQHPKTPHELAKSSHTKITFADSTTAGPSTSLKPTTTSKPTLKTPGTAYKSSPQYPNGDNISLPDIATDSEDDDDETAFQPPDWANSPALRELLQQQQLRDPLEVFGPIAPLMMEEVFKGNKERQARFRSRTSSANWNGPDRLTDSERRRDLQARERMEANGGWVYGGGGAFS